ncbi:MAG: hypothetical protein EZS28_047695, partial [Streblomastix strix]
NPYLLTVHTVADNDVFTNAGFLLSNWRINRTIQEHFDGIPQLKEDGSGIEAELLANSQAQAQGSAQQQVQAGSIPGVPQTSGVGSADKQAVGQKGTTLLSQQHHTQSMLNVSPLMQQMASPLTTTYSQLVSTQFGLPSYPQALLPIMLRFMNLTLLSQQQLIKWPESAIETFGMPLIEAIEHLLSQQIHGKVNPELIKSASTSVVIQSRDYVNDQFGLGDGTDRAKSGMGGYSESVSGLKGVTGGTQNNQGTPQKSNANTQQTPRPSAVTSTPKPKATASQGQTQMTNTQQNQKPQNNPAGNQPTKATTGRQGVMSGSGKGEEIQLTPIEQELRNAPQAQHSERIRLLLAHYDALLIFMKEQGALLGPLKPEYFMPHADFARYSADVYVASVYHFPVPDFNQILFAIQR